MLGLVAITACVTGAMLGVASICNPSVTHPYVVEMVLALMTVSVLAVAAEHAVKALMGWLIEVWQLREASRLEMARLIIRQQGVRMFLNRKVSTSRGRS